MEQKTIKYEPIHLKKLEKISNNDTAFMKFICSLFIKETATTENRFRHLCQNKNYKEIKYLLHQCKPRFDLINDVVTTQLITEIESHLEHKKKSQLFQDLAAKLLVRFKISREKIEILLKKK